MLAFSSRARASASPVRPASVSSAGLVQADVLLGGQAGQAVVVGGGGQLLPLGGPGCRRFRPGRPAAARRRPARPRRRRGLCRPAPRRRGSRPAGLQTGRSPVPAAPAPGRHCRRRRPGGPPPVRPRSRSAAAVMLSLSAPVSWACRVSALGLAVAGGLSGGVAGGLQPGQAGAQLLQLLLAAEHAHAAGGGATGKAAARVDDLPVQRNDAVAVAQVPGHGGRLGQVLHHDDAAQQVVDDVLVAGVGLHQVGGHLGGAGQPAAEAAALHGVQRQKGGAAALFRLQKGDGGAGRTFRPPPRCSARQSPARVSMATS